MNSYEHHDSLLTMRMQEIENDGRALIVIRSRVYDISSFYER